MLSPPAHGDQNRGWVVLSLHSVLAVIVVALLLARMYTRTLIVRKTGLDDYLISIGVVSETAKE